MLSNVQKDTLRNLKIKGTTFSQFFRFYLQDGAKIVTLVENAITFTKAPNVNSVLTFVKQTKKISNGLNKEILQAEPKFFIKKNSKRTSSHYFCPTLFIKIKKFRQRLGTNNRPKYFVYTNINQKLERRVVIIIVYDCVRLSVICLCLVQV